MRRVSAKKRRPNADERRRELCDAAISVLAEDGARGLTHRKVEQRAGLPDGTTSSYFPTRSALLHGVAQRVAELDADDFSSVTSTLDNSTPTTLSQLAQLVMRSAHEPGLSRSRARYELALHARRDSVVRADFDSAIAGFVTLSQQAVAQLQPDLAAEHDLIEEQAYAVTTFINGVMMRLALGDATIHTADQLDRLLHALIAGIAASHHARAHMA